MELMSQYDPIAQRLRRKIKILEAESKKQTAALKMAKKALEGMKLWFDAEENHNGTTFAERCYMCSEVQNQVPDVLAAIDAAMQEDKP